MQYPEHLTRVALYLRKSRADVEAERQGSGETLARHRRALHELAGKHNYAIGQTFEEIVSGELIVDRPEMQRLLRGVRDRQYTAVLCMDLDRLGRGDGIDQGLIHRAFKDSGTLIITPRKVYDLHDDLDEEWAEFESFMARREFRIIVRRMQRGKRQSAAEGKSISRKPPYGYLRDDTGRLYPDPARAPIVQLMFDLRQRGYGLVRLAHELERMNAPHPINFRGRNEWTHSTVREILCNDAYIGRIVWGKFRSAKDSDGHRRKQRVSPRDWVIAENAHPALIEKAAWDTVQDIRNGQHHSPVDHALKNTLAGIVRCAVCGKVMLRRTRKDRPHALLVCKTYECPTRSATCERVEQRVLEQLTQLCTDLPSRTIAAPRTKSTVTRYDVLKQSIDEVQSELNQLRTQQNNLHDLLERGIYDGDTFLERNSVVRERVERLTSKLTDFHADMQTVRDQLTSHEILLPGIGTVVEQLRRTNDVALRNRMLKMVFSHIAYRRTGTDADFELDLFLNI